MTLFVSAEGRRTSSILLSSALDGYDRLRHHGMDSRRSIDLRLESLQATGIRTSLSGDRSITLQNPVHVLQVVANRTFWFETQLRYGAQPIDDDNVRRPSNMHI
jgi:hypothetical protein